MGPELFLKVTKANDRKNIIESSYEADVKYIGKTLARTQNVLEVASHASKLKG